MNEPSGTPLINPDIGIFDAEETNDFPLQEER